MHSETNKCLAALLHYLKKTKSFVWVINYCPQIAGHYICEFSYTCTFKMFCMTLGSKWCRVKNFYFWSSFHLVLSCCDRKLSDKKKTESIEITKVLFVQRSWLNSPISKFVEQYVMTGRLVIMIHIFGMWASIITMSAMCLLLTTVALLIVLWTLT